MPVRGREMLFLRLLPILSGLLAPWLALAGRLRTAPIAALPSRRRRARSSPPRCAWPRSRQRGAPDVRGPRDLAHRERRRDQDRHRLQRLHPPLRGARDRHHEPGPQHALLAGPRSRHQARAARLEPGGRPGQARPDARRRARAQRRHQHPRLGRRLNPPRQLDLHLRDCRHVHRPPGPPASHAHRRSRSPTSASSTW